MFYSAGDSDKLTFTSCTAITYFVLCEFITYVQNCFYINGMMWVRCNPPLYIASTIYSVEGVASVE